VLGASFSALEVVPLAYIGFEAYERYKQGHATPWMTRYRWPVIVLLGGCLLEHVGAGLLGFLINPPLSLYYMQGSCWVCGSAAIRNRFALFRASGASSCLTKIRMS
jgi:nitric oxide reductase large subunit